MNNRYLKDVSTLKLNSGKCAGCGMCVDVCPHGVFALKEGKAEIIEKDRCMECGACAKNCPSAAIEVRPGVGCAYAIIMGRLRGMEPICSCAEDSSGCC